MRLPVSDRALINLLLDSKQYNLTSLARELNLHRNTLARVLDGSSCATHKTSMRLLGFYLSSVLSPPIEADTDLIEAEV